MGRSVAISELRHKNRTVARKLGGWTHELGQLCDDAGAESCSFFCPHYREMMKALKTHPNIPPTWAHPEQPEYWQSDNDGNDGEIPF